ncbi:Uncharacterised protein [Streptococcus pneumoniae]|nr:Uncharacterised protein [Streptococcus pneumoniae]
MAVICSSFKFLESFTPSSFSSGICFASTYTATTVIGPKKSPVPTSSDPTIDIVPMEAGGA